MRLNGIGSVNIIYWLKIVLGEDGTLEPYSFFGLH